MLYGYGGFNISFDASFLVLLMQYGWKTGRLRTIPALGARIWKKWHDAGTKLQTKCI
jgi:prolyl oligopeptidase PreP (S9A serine peptidase family)